MCLQLVYNLFKDPVNTMCETSTKIYWRVCVCVQPIKIITLLLLRFLYSAVSNINQLLLGYCLLLLCQVRSRIIYHPTNYETENQNCPIVISGS